MIGPVFIKKAFEKQGLFEDKNNNKYFEKFLLICRKDKEISENWKNINFRKDFNEENIKANETVIFSNIDSFFKNNFNKRKKILLIYSYKNALNIIKDIDK